MPWVKLDDGFHSHPKALAVGLEGCGLFARALSYCGAYLTDGRVPREWVDAQIGDRTDIPKTLADVGLWERTDDGDYLIADFTDLNPSKAEHTERMAEAARRAKASRDRRAKGGKG